MATINGTAANDTLTGTVNSDVINGLGGNDVLNGGDGNDTLIGGAGADVLNGGNGTDYASYSTASAGISINLLTGIHTGDAAGDTFSGIEGYIGTNYADTFVGSSGNDIIIGGLITGLGDWDAVDYSDATAAVSFFGTSNSTESFGTVTGGSTGTDVLTHIAVFIGSDFNDTMNSDSRWSRLYGGAGNDTYIVGNSYVEVYENASEGNDELQTTLASYTLQANIERLTYIGATNFVGNGNALDNIITSQGGNDTLIGGAGADVLNGGNGTDYASYSTASAGISINLLTGIHTGDAAGDTFSGIEGYIGTNYADTFVGSSGNDIIIGGLVTGLGDWDAVDYSDATAAVSFFGTSNSTESFGTVTGGSTGTDVLTHIAVFIGSDFNDTMNSDSRWSRLYGGAGNDTYIVGNSYVEVHENASEGTDTLKTTLASYTLPANVENLVYIGTGNFTGTGGSADDQITGNTGIDSLFGLGGNDVLNGGDGNDTLVGGAGADVLNGGNGTDYASYSTASAGISINLLTGIHAGDAAGDTFSGIEGYIGTNYADTFVGSSGNDIIIGGLITGLGDWDAVDYSDATAAVSFFGTSNSTESFGTVTGGSTGTDVLTHIAVFIGSDFNDTMNSDSRWSRLYGGVGNDTYIVGNSYVEVYENASEGNDELQTALASYTLQANIERLTYIGATNFVGNGNALDNIITSQGGNDRLFGLDGNDTLVGGAGNDTLTGGNGQDTASYWNSNAAVNVNLATLVTSGGHAAGDVLASMENLEGSAFNDVLAGSTGNNTLVGLAGNDSISGNDGNDFIDGGSGGDTIDGGNGTDTLTYALSSAAVTINLVTGVNGGGFAAGDVISAVELIVGTGLADTFTAAGVITLDGGTGNDTYVIDGTGVTIIEDSSGGTDTARTSLTTYTLAANVENLVYTGTTSTTLTGNALDNVLTGGANNDVLSGGSGNDTLIGGAGADSLSGGLGTDTVSYAASSSGVAVNLATLSGSAGDAAGDTLSGIEVVIGSAFADTLTAASAATFVGGTGDDIYIVNGSGIVITEGAGEGNETVQTSLNSLSLANNVENLTYTGAGNATLTGNTLANILTGSTGNDVLIGGVGGDTLVGGAGTDTVSYAASSAGVSVNLVTLAVSGGDATGDLLSSIEGVIGSSFADTLTASSAATLAGGGGDDLYIVNGSGVILTEAASSGNDTVQTSLNTYTLASNVENLTFTGAGNATLTGSNVANIITGGSGDDVLNAGAGDTLIGGVGNDIYVLSSTATGVVLNETAGNGIDTVQTSILSFSLATNIENLTFTGTGNATLSGNSFANILTGGIGNDVLIGGAGGDTLNGGNGTDTVSYATSAAAVSVDLTTLAVSGGDAAGDVLSSIEGVIGSSFADTLTAASAATLAGGTGDDLYIVDGLGVILTEAASSGNDTVQTSLNTYTLASNIENLTFTGAGNATLTGNGLANVIIGGIADDVLTGAGGADTLVGGEGDDTYVVNSTGVVLTETSNNGTDLVRTSLNAFTLVNNIENLTFAGMGNATLTGNSLDNTITSGVGDDVLIGGAGSDSLFGGGGTDTASYANAATAVTIDLATGIHTGDAAGDVYSSIESIVGSSYDDIFRGDDGANAFFGGAGADIFVGSAGADTMNGSNGTDTVDYSGSSSSVAVDLAAGTGMGGDADDDTLISIEQVVGSNFADIFTANSPATLLGGAGDDVYIIGGVGVMLTETFGDGVDSVQTTLTNMTLSDNLENLAFTGVGNFAGTGNSLANIITGSTGDDILAGGNGADTLDGGDGADTADYSASSSAINVNLITGVGIGGEADSDTLISIERVLGSSFADTLTAASGSTLLGGEGDDIYIINDSGVDLIETPGNGNDSVQTSLNVFTLASNIEDLTFTGMGNATLTGNNIGNIITSSTGDDTLLGGGGNDILVGGIGSDTLGGDNGADTFLFGSVAASNGLNGVDQITDFSQSEGDIIDLSALGGLTFVDTASFSGVAGELRYENTGDDTFIFADLDGDMTADMEIKLNGTVTLTSGDFVL